MRERLLIEVRGVVQGDGFRPFIHSLATSHGLHGFVQNRGTHADRDIRVAAHLATCHTCLSVGEHQACA
jgi:hydrogenase maturation protein HypF